MARPLIGEVARKLEAKGWKVELESEVPTGYRPDIIVHDKEGKTLVVECKVEARHLDPTSTSLTYDVIGVAAHNGQAYQKDHPGLRVVPVVVGNFKVPKMVAEIAQATGVQVIVVTSADPNAVVEAIARIFRN